MEVGIVLLEQDVVFGLGGKYVVRFFGIFVDEVVDEYIDVVIGVVQYKWCFFFDGKVGIDIGDQFLIVGFFVIGGVVDLFGEVKVVDEFGFQCKFQLCRLEEVVFDGIVWVEYFGIFKILDFLQCFVLYIFWQGR